MLRIFSPLSNDSLVYNHDSIPCCMTVLCLNILPTPMPYAGKLLCYYSRCFLAHESEYDVILYRCCRWLLLIHLHSRHAVKMNYLCDSFCIVKTENKPLSIYYIYLSNTSHTFVPIHALCIVYISGNIPVGLFDSVFFCACHFGIYNSVLRLYAISRHFFVLSCFLSEKFSVYVHRYFVYAHHHLYLCMFPQFYSIYCIVLD